MDDGEWQDVPEVDFAPLSQTQSASSSPIGVQKAIRRRKTHKTASLTRTPSVSSRRSATPVVPLREETPTLVDYEQMQRDVLSGASSIVSYIVNVLAIAKFWLLKKPLAVLAFVVTLAFCRGASQTSPAFVFAYVYPRHLIQHVLDWCHCIRFGHHGQKPKSANFAQLVKLQDSFESIMDANVRTGAIGLKLKGSEMVMRDLVARVRASDLTSRDTLAETLLRFVEDAKKTGEGLHRLSAKINGAVDDITTMNGQAMRTIEAVSNRGSFSLSRIMTRTDTEAVILRSFEDALDTLTKETHRAVLEASVSAANLERLQEHLLTIHEIITRESVALNDAQAELPSELWTILSGDGSTRHKSEMHLTLLRYIGRYRKEATAHVVFTHEVLQEVEADAEELRERAAAPAIVGDRVPAEVLLQSIGDGIEKLKAGRQRTSEKRQALMDKLLASPGDVLGIKFD
ncbi:uncharacterized protein B0H18DRAFT_873504 [Fomitopsis serialis]|uniref:uncharacterized protein n=1 Tax=Fomitopsis serialis TaxID=139415 RepID=UPI002008AD11|nr:uncharacterized protein B0H18DRAFT_873504 [Neoantrodia serialis]KAH9930053.1 hypothetical protein B0H18DRAFT_873504 [Neoantrodia serialis]